jgi:hypothetical protein
MDIKTTSEFQALVKEVRNSFEGVWLIWIWWMLKKKMK